MDVDNLTLEQMLELQKKINAAIPDRKKQRLETLRGEIREKIELAGLTLEEVLRPLLQNKAVKKSASKGTRKPAAVKYRLNDKTWTGKGKTPQWVLDYVSAGGDKEQLRVSIEDKAD